MNLAMTGSSLLMRLVAILSLSAMTTGCQSIPNRSAADRVGIKGIAAVGVSPSPDVSSNSRTSRSIMFSSEVITANTDCEKTEAYKWASPWRRAEVLVSCYEERRRLQPPAWQTDSRRDKWNWGQLTVPEKIGTVVATALVVGWLMQFKNKSKTPHYPPWPDTCPLVLQNGNVFVCDGP